MDFKVGDVVILKSGSPPMTIEEVSNYSSDTHKARCSWFDGNKKCMEFFVLESLEKFE